MYKVWLAVAAECGALQQKDASMDDIRTVVRMYMPDESEQVIDNVVQAIKEYHP